MPAAEELDITTPDAVGSPEAGLSAVDLIKPWLQIVVASVVLFLFTVTFVAQGFSVFGSCMEPNLKTGERVLGNKLIYRIESPARGDVVVFKYPRNPNKTFIKRVVGLPGETIEIRDGRVFINSRQLSEPYLVNTPHGWYGPEKIASGRLFVMGDYRDQSNDSRYWGELPVRNVQAKAWIRYWPVKRMRVMR